MILFWLVVLAVIVGALWLVLQAVQRRGDARQPMESAEEILRQRYARGEIDHEAFLRMLDDLKRDPSSRTSHPN
jgi:uncharacterized membrane protein